MNRMQSRDELLAYIRDRLREFFDAEQSQILLISDDGVAHPLGGGAEGEEEGRRAAARVPVSRTVLRRVLQHRKPVLVRDARRDPELRRQSSVRALGLGSVLCAPLVVDDRVLGVVHFAHRDGDQPFAEEDLALLSLFAQQAAAALHNVLLAEEREHVLAQLREARGRLATGERLRALGQAAAGVAHDFNNLLAAILGLTELLRTRTDVPEDVRTLLERLRSCASDGASTVRRLRDFSGAPGETRKPEAVDLDAVAREVGDMCSGRARAADGTTRHVVAVECGAVRPVLGHAAELREVVMNLVVNAFDAMPGGGKVTLRSLERDGRCLLEVEDEGPGVPPELRQRIFEPFFSTKGGSGRGLGLSICWGIVNRMGGTIDVRSGPCRGSVFSLAFAPVAAEKPKAKRRAAKSKKDKRHGPCRVLVVDDDPLVREAFVGMLQTLGHATVEAAGAAEALERLQDSRCQVVLTDRSMPGMGGIQLAREVRRRWPRKPVVLVTGTLDEVTPQNREDITVVVRKPLGIEELGTAIDAARALRPGRRAATRADGRDHAGPVRSR
jgi:signal transduction histidine kinase